MHESPTLPLEPMDSERVWTVSELLAEVRGGLEATFPTVWVRGEISGLRRQASGHWYFNLKDDSAVLNVAMFRGDNIAVPFELEDGLEITAMGRLTLYERAGRFQLIANLLEPVGWGAQQLAFEQLKRRLQAEGLFADERKRTLPGMPACVGVVTSDTGAAWRDMTRVWERRGVNLRVILSPSTVQGPSAAAQIAAAIELLEHHGEAEVVIVGRGGGSREDLWAFNEERVARVIAACAIPVISAVGHEIDVTIADLVADLRAATPTAAAEIVAPARDELLSVLEGLRQRAGGALKALTQRAHRRLYAPPLHRALRRPERSLQAYHQRLDLAWEELEGTLEASLLHRAKRLEMASRALARVTPLRAARRQREALAALSTRLRGSATDRVHAARERLGTLAARTEALSPVAVLGRGYALCRTPDGRLLLRAADVDVGDRVQVRLAAGSLECEVLQTQAPQ